MHYEAKKNEKKLQHDECEIINSEKKENNESKKKIIELFNYTDCVKSSTRLEKCRVELRSWIRELKSSWEAWFNNSTWKLDSTRQDIR